MRACSIIATQFSPCCCFRSSANLIFLFKSSEEFYEFRKTSYFLKPLLYIYIFLYFFWAGDGKGSPWEEEPGKSGVGIAHVRLHPPPQISIFSLRRPRFSPIERSREIELRVSLTFRLASPKLTQPRLLIRESGEEDGRAVSYVKTEQHLRELRA